MKVQIFTAESVSYLLEKFSDILEDETLYTKDDCVYFLRKMARYIKEGKINDRN